MGDKIHTNYAKIEFTSRYKKLTQGWAKTLGAHELLVLLFGKYFQPPSIVKLASSGLFLMEQYTLVEIDLSVFHRRNSYDKNHSYRQGKTIHSKDKIKRIILRKIDMCSGTATTLLFKFDRYQCRRFIIGRDNSDMCCGAATSRLFQSNADKFPYSGKNYQKVLVSSKREVWKCGGRLGLNNGRWNGYYLFLLLRF
ncbi:hypothetical protein Tco_1107254 [Tanacetum coccineum]